MDAITGVQDCFWTSLVGQMVKESACNAGDLGSIPGKIPLEKGMATHSSIAFRLQKCYAEAPDPKQVHAGVFLLRGKGLQTCSLPQPPPPF